MPATTSPHLKEGRYNIEQEFNSGKDRSVFQAYDIKSEEPVTIAEIPVRLPKVATISQREAVAAAFSEQATSLAVFKHKSALAIRDHFVEAGRHYVVTDPMDGVDLTSVLTDQDHPFAVSEITSWSDTLLDVLNSLHICRPPFVYKHLRPDCVIQRADGSAALALWGMIDLNSRISGAADTSDSDGSSIVYSPLEQIWGGLDAASQKVIVSKYDEASERTLKQPLDPRSDIYSLGAVLYHLSTGRTPVDALERSIEMIEGGPDPLKAPNKINTSIPTEISDVIMKAMDIRREYRFDSAAIMRQVMRTAVVRVKEREEEERREEQEALANIKSVAAGPSPAPADNSTSGTDDKVVSSVTKGDPQRSNQEQPARATETFELTELEDDLLGLLAPAGEVSTPPDPIHVSSPAEVTATSSLKNQQPAASENAPETVAAKVSLSEVRPESEVGSSLVDTALTDVALSPVTADKVTKSSPALNVQDPAGGESLEKDSTDVGEVKAVEPERAEKASSSYTSEAPDLYPVEKGSSRGVMVVAAGLVVACLVAVGGWFYLGSGTKASTSNAAPPSAVMTQPQAEVTVQTEPQPSPSPELTIAAEQEPQPEPDAITTDEQQPQKVAASSPQRPRKQSPAAPKTAAPKKAVTVDDLINDN